MTTLFILAVCAVLSTVNALPVEDVQLAINDSELHNREVRSLIGWHLDRIDQRERILDGKYCPIGQGKLILSYV